ncbi:MAG: hypothetical protein WBH14_13610 [Albidovulum sp.]
MVDKNLQNFYGRVGRIERIHDAGGGFEANGTLGMSYYNARKRSKRRVGLLGPLALILMTIIGIKAAVYTTLGPDAYSLRISTLQAGTTADQIGAYVLQADPLTVMVADQVRSLIR